MMLEDKEVVLQVAAINEKKRIAQEKLDAVNKEMAELEGELKKIQANCSHTKTLPPSGRVQLFLICAHCESPVEN